MRSLAIAASLGVFLCAPLLSQEGKQPDGKGGQKQEGGKNAPADPDKALSERLKSQVISLNLDETPLGDVASFLTDITGVPVVVGPGVDTEAPVTLKLNGVSLKDALKLITASQEGLVARPYCGVLWLGQKGQRLPAPPAIPADGPLAQRVTLNFSGTPAPEALDFLRDVCPTLKLLVSEPAKAKLEAETTTLRVADLPVIRVLALLQAMHGLTSKQEGDTVELDVAPEQEKKPGD